MFLIIQMVVHRPPYVHARLRQEFLALEGNVDSYSTGRRAELALCITQNNSQSTTITIPNNMIDAAFRTTMRRLGVPCRFINTDLVGTDIVTFTLTDGCISIHTGTQVKNTTLPVDVPTLASLKCLKPHVPDEKVEGAFGNHFDFVSTGGFTSRATTHAQMLAKCILVMPHPF